MKKLIILSAIALLGFASCKKSTVEPDPVVKPVFDFETEYKDYFIGQKIEFKNKSTNAKDYFWYFGDGSSSKEVNPIKSYSTIGIYEVTFGDKKELISIHPETHSVYIDNKTDNDIKIVLFDRINDDLVGNERYDLGIVKSGTKSKVAFTNKTKIGVSGIWNGINFVIMTPRFFNMEVGKLNVITINPDTKLSLGLSLPPTK